jgi:catalase
MNHHRDGAMRHKITPGKFNYWPNRGGVVPPASKPEQGGYQDYPEKIVAMKARLNSKKFAEHFSQAQVFWNSMSPIEKKHICKALAFELDHCDDPVVYQRMCLRLTDIDLGLAQQVAALVGAETPTEAGRPNPGLTSKGLSQMDFTPHALGLKPTAVKTALTAAGAFVFTIGPRRQPVKAAGGTSVRPEHHWEAMRSTAFDSLYIPGGEHVNIIRKTGRAVHWIKEAFGHLKAIGATGEAVQLVREAVGVEGMTFATAADECVNSYGVVTAAGVGEGPSSIKEGIQMIKGAKNFCDAYAFEISQHRNFDRELAGLSDMVAY